MLIVETVCACIPAYVYGLIWARRYLHKAKHSRCLANIRRIELDLGLRDDPLVETLMGAHAIKHAARAKALNYSAGTRSTPKSAAARWAEGVNGAGRTYQA